VGRSTGLDPGPASLEDPTAEAAEWRLGLAPERARYAALGPEGPPTAAKRRLSATLADAFGCRICQALLVAMWQELPEPSRPAMERWFDDGCAPAVRRTLVLVGWQITSDGCGGAGFHANGTTWCFIQDPTSRVVRERRLAEVYEPLRDVLFLACAQTIGVHGRAVAAHMVVQRGDTPAGARNERLAAVACAEAAFCGRANAAEVEAARAAAAEVWAVQAREAMAYLPRGAMDAEVAAARESGAALGLRRGAAEAEAARAPAAARAAGAGEL